MPAFTPARSDVGRRTDGTAYETAHPQFLGKGITRSCAKCGNHRPQSPGWKKTAWGLTAPCCLPDPKS